MRVQETAYAKINLALHVRRRRADGYHDIETIFAFAKDGDELTVEPSERLTLDVDGPLASLVPAGRENLVLRAADVLGEGRGAAIRLTKRLPVAAGLGGGSADAAATLRALNQLWGLGRSLDELAALGASLGADVAACVHSRTLRGEADGSELSPVDPAGLTGMAVLLVNPRVLVPTSAVFARWDGVDRGPVARGDPVAAAAAGRNDLEAPALEIAPAIAEVLDLLSAQRGTRLARMSGSGATCFALFDGQRACEAAASAIADARPDWWTMASRLR